MTTNPLTATFVTVKVDNKPGTLGKCSRAIANANINVESFFGDGATIRFLTNNPGGTVDAVKKAGFTAQTTDLFAIRLPNTPGQVAALGEELGKVGVNIETCFSVGGTRENGRIFLLVNDPSKAQPVIERLSTVQPTVGGRPTGGMSQPSTM